MAAPYRRLARYRLIARLGSGGMADVYLAVCGHPGGVHKVQVLKVLRPDLNEQERPEFLRMFEDEGRLAVRLNHPNIVQSHEVGSEDGHHFIAMEYLDGQPLNRVEERAATSDGRFPLDMRLFVLCQVLEGLDYAHHLKDYGGLPLHIVHRDISPQNVFVTYSGQTKLVDFGIAKTLESSKTRAGVVKGKVPYMAPEQVLSESVDHRTDLFSVGVMLWEAIACRPMYGAQSIYEIMRRLVQGSVISIRDVVPDVPEPLEAIVNRALQHKPEDRYQDASAFHHDLSSYLDSLRRVNARDVGECVAQLFAQERREIDDVIRRALTEATEPNLAPINLQALEVIPTVRSSL
ncbi:MAG TPA: serine/threonine-protein kinase, partial [Polyangiaceae bacterium]